MWCFYQVIFSFCTVFLFSFLWQPRETERIQVTDGNYGVTIYGDDVDHRMNDIDDSDNDVDVDGSDDDDEEEE